MAREQIHTDAGHDEENPERRCNHCGGAVAVERFWVVPLLKQPVRAAVRHGNPDYRPPTPLECVLVEDLGHVGR